MSQLKVNSIVPVGGLPSGATGNFTVKLKCIVTNSGSSVTATVNRNFFDGDRINDPSGISTLTLMEVSG